MERSVVGTVHSMNVGLASDRSLSAAAADNAFLAISTEKKSESHYRHIRL